MKTCVSKIKQDVFTKVTALIGDAKCVFLCIFITLAEFLWQTLHNFAGKWGCALSNTRVSGGCEHASNHVWERVRPHLHYHKRLLRGHPLHFITHAGNDISRRTGNHTYLSLIYGLKDWNKSAARVSLPSYPYPQSPLIPLNQGKSGRYVPFIRRLIACSITCSVFQISQTTSIRLMARRMSLRADRDR